MLVKFEDEEYTLDLDDIDLNQAMLIKSKTGMTLKAWNDAITEADPEALRALYWLMLEQNGKRMVYERIQFKVVKFFAAFADAMKDEAESEKPDPKPKSSRSGS